MAWCQNEHCQKDGLRKADIEFCETTRKILCHGCYALMHPGWIPKPEYVDLTSGIVEPIAPPRLGFAFQYAEDTGLKAQVSYGQLTFAVMAPPEELKRLFGI